MKNQGWIPVPILRPPGIVGISIDKELLILFQPGGIARQRQARPHDNDGVRARREAPERREGWAREMREMLCTNMDGYVPGLAYSSVTIVPRMCTAALMLDTMTSPFVGLGVLHGE